MQITKTKKNLSSDFVQYKVYKSFILQKYSTHYRTCCSIYGDSNKLNRANYPYSIKTSKIRHEMSFLSPL